MNAVTPEAIALIKAYEGLCLTARPDPIGIPTIGYGHKIVPGLDRFSTITGVEADALLDGDVALKSAWVSAYIKVPLNDNQFSALVSLVFNVGVTPLCDTLGKLLNEADYQGCAGQFGRWIYGKVDGVERALPGLVARREAERELFLTPTDEQLPWLAE